MLRQHRFSHLVRLKSVPDVIARAMQIQGVDITIIVIGVLGVLGSIGITSRLSSSSCFPSPCHISLTTYNSTITTYTRYACCFVCPGQAGAGTTPRRPSRGGRPASPATWTRPPAPPSGRGGIAEPRCLWRPWALSRWRLWRPWALSRRRLWRPWAFGA